MDKVNIEGADFEENLSRIMQEHNIKGFNIILSTLVLHHLNLQHIYQVDLH